MCGVWGPHPSHVLGHLTNLPLSLGLLSLHILIAHVEKQSSREGRATPLQVTQIVDEESGICLRLEEALESLLTRVLILRNKNFLMQT